MQKGSIKTKLTANSKIRRCVVRVKRMKPQQSKNNKRTVAARPAPANVKNRPTGPASAVAAARLSTSLSTSLKAKDRVKTPIVAKKVVEQLKKVATPVVAELPPTIAAGRSRRVHKPNPRYANEEEFLTPKSLKAAVVDDSKTNNDSEYEGATRTTKATKTTKAQVEIESDSDFDENDEDSDSSQFERITRSRPVKATNEPITRRSTAGVVNASSLNRTAPNAKSVPTQLQQLRRTLNASNLSPLAMGKKRKLEESSPSTTTALPSKRPNTAASTPVVAVKRPTTAVTTPLVAAKKPNMPTTATTIVATKKPATPVVVTKKPNAATSTPGGAARNQQTTTLANKKPNTTTSTPVVAAKRPSISSATQKLSENNAILKRRQSPSVTLSESKAKPNVTASTLSLDKDKKSSPLALTRSSSVANLKTTTTSKTQLTPPQRPFISRNNLNKASSASTPSLSKGSVGQSPNATPPTAPAASKTRSSLSKPASSNKQQTKTATPESTKKPADDYISSDLEETPTITIDDFETMPTFTIVNINDIINKKGDVLISESADESKTKPAATRKPETTRNVQKQQTPTQTQPSKPQTQLSKQQTQQNKQTAKKSSPEAVKIQSSQAFSTSTPLVKKPVGNNAQANKLTGRTSTGNTKLSPTAVKSTTEPVVTRPTTRSGTASANASDKKPAPRILNSVVSPRTKPIKPVINNLDVSDDDPSGSLSLYTDDDDEEDEEHDADELDDSKYTNASMLDTDSDYTGNESELIESPKKRIQAKRSPASTAASKRKIITPPKAAKENSAAVNNCLPKKQAPQAKQMQSAARKLSPEKVVVQREGNKIIKKITCFETWYVINIPADAPEEYERNTLDMPLIDLANSAKEIKLPSDIWTTKVTLFEVRKSLKDTNFTIYNGDLTEQKIKESDRAKYQPSCVMFRRTVADRVKLQLPYDRAVIFKNKTFFTNIEGKNVKLVGAPTSIKEASEVETLLNIVDGLTLQSPFVEPASTIL